MKRSILFGVLALLVVAWSAPATAQDMVTVRITNVSKQIISPPLVATHTWRARIFVPGNAASTELSLLAEDGSPTELAAALIDKSKQNQRVMAPVWDAGSEYNNEMCAFIPGPPCMNPLVRDTDGAEGFIHVHPGISGAGDLSPADWNWHNPAVDILIAKR